VQVCPVACIPLNPQFVESQEKLWDKYRRLTSEKKMAEKAQAITLTVPQSSPQT
jgi:hypothetical protein